LENSREITTLAQKFKIMNSNFDITIGIPIYNVEKYIKKSLLSALNQDFDGKIEILIINDSTKDNSMTIVNSIANSHPNGKNIRILNQPENKGLSIARNTIIDNCQGEYLLFMDSDDYISNDCINILYKEAISHNADVVYGAIKTVDENGAPLDIGQEYLIQEYKVLCKKDEFGSYVFRDMHQYVRDYATNTLFNVSFIKKNNFYFKSVRFYEDVMFSADIVPLVSRGVIVPNVTYYYVIRSNSLSNYQGREKINLEEIKQFINIFTYIKNKNKFLKDKPYYEARCARSMVQMLFILSGALKNRKVITPPLSNRMIKDAMKHPASLLEILRFKKHCLVNLLFYVIGILPSWLSAAIVIGIAKKKKLI
jgi:glycosyltransferase involved in cell wall biosynthesis